MGEEVCHAGKVRAVVTDLGGVLLWRREFLERALVHQAVVSEEIRPLNLNSGRRDGTEEDETDQGGE